MFAFRDEALKDTSAQNHSDSVEQSDGARIKADLNLAASKTFGKSEGESLFDGIDEKSIELNLSLADSVISSNRRRGAYSAADLDNLPNLRGGLAAFYAAAESGDSKAANAAWKIAYTPAKQTEERLETKSRYVGEDNLTLHSAPGESAPNIGSLSRGDEVYFTGNKTKETDGNSWAEVRYRDKTGWVQSNSLKTDKSQALAGTRYVGEETISMRAIPGLRGHTKGTIDYGKEVHFTGSKETLDGIDWAEVSYGNKKGWVLANSLRTEMPYSVIDKNAPKEIIVSQKMDAEERASYLNKMIPEWMAEKGDYPMNHDMIEWYNNNGANVKYTGTYCLPIKANMSRISQGFYGSYSHAGAYDPKDKKYNYETGKYGAVDIAASKGTPVYSVLGGKVVYTYKEAPKADMHRVTVETTINDEIYYIEYLHMDKVKVETGQTLHIGTPIGTVGGWGSNSDGAFGNHLDFRIYKFTNENVKSFRDDSKKQFFDPFEFFDFDIHYKPALGIIDYN